ncbi:MAG: hypothetical protein KF777_01620 [Planctomycetaceae bacterium]|nr:hypothetical protein [Planctomycetaceae bacterium]
MSRQLDWQEIWGNDDRQRAARHTLIEGLPDVLASDRVKKLLHALDELTQIDPQAERLADGSVRVSAPMQTVMWKLGVRSRNTARDYIDEALSTGFLEVTGSSHRSHTYSIRWLAILDRNGNQQTEPIPAGVMPQKPNGPGRCGRVPVRGSTPGPQGVKLTPSRGSVDPVEGGQFDRVKGVNLTPSSKTSLRPVFYELNSKRPVLRPVSDRGQIPRWGSPRFFAWWRHAIAERNLDNPSDVEELFCFAAAAGCFEATDDNRFQVFVQAAVDRRVAARRGAIFRENVAAARWYGSCADEDEAARMIARLEFAAAEDPPVEAVPDDVDQGPEVPVQTHVDLLAEFEAKRAARAAK